VVKAMKETRIRPRFFLIPVSILSNLHCRWTNSLEMAVSLRSMMQGEAGRWRSGNGA